MTKVGILDDEVVICETLSKYLKALGYEVPDYAMSYEEGMDLLKNEQPDIMLLDVNIGGEKTGIDLARHIRENYNIPLIFISSYSDSATVQQAKSVQANGYLVKPFTKEDLFTAIEMALANYSASFEKNNTDNEPLSTDLKLMQDAIFIKKDSLYIKVNYTDIRYIKSEGVYAEIITQNKELLIRETMRHLLDVLPKDIFLQIHRSYIINMQHIDAVNGEYVLIDSKPIPISKTYREEFLSKLNII